MNFERLSFQSWIESHLNCTNLETWSTYRAALQGIVLHPADIVVAEDLLKRDGTSLLQRAFLSFSGAYEDLGRGNGSWGVVKLYYCLFYSVRSRLLFRKHGLIRNGSWFHFDFNNSASGSGNSPVRLTGDRFRSDHDTSINLYERIFGGSDRLLSNSVDSVPPLQWLMDLRNIANYRIANFTDPVFPMDILVGGGGVEIESLVQQSINDVDDGLTFQPEFAWLALPMKQLIGAVGDMAACGASMSLSAEKKAHLQSKFSSLPECLRNELSGICS